MADAVYVHQVSKGPLSRTNGSVGSYRILSYQRLYVEKLDLKTDLSMSKKTHLSSRLVFGQSTDTINCTALRAKQARRTSFQNCIVRGFIHQNVYLEEDDLQQLTVTLKTHSKESNVSHYIGYRLDSLNKLSCSRFSVSSIEVLGVL